MENEIPTVGKWYSDSAALLVGGSIISIFILGVLAVLRKKVFDWLAGLLGGNDEALRKDLAKAIDRIEQLESEARAKRLAEHTMNAAIATLQEIARDHAERFHNGELIMNELKVMLQANIQISQETRDTQKSFNEAFTRHLMTQHAASPHGF